MDWWYDAKPTIRTDEGIRARSQRGSFAANWWAERWLAAMEQLMDRGRLQRGRRYARQGQVLSVNEEGEEVIARVQGSQRTPYRVTIAVEPLDDADWAQVEAALAARPLFLAQLLAGEMPPEIEEAFAEVGLSLFPSSASELTQSCSCPDWADVCKHLAAVHYILAERFDEDPFLLFRLRGRSQEALLAALGPQAVPDGDAPAAEPPPPLPAEPRSFWGTGQLPPVVAPASPTTAYPVLERLGPPAFLPEGTAWLEQSYDEISRAARAALLADSELDDEQEEHP